MITTTCIASFLNITSTKSDKNMNKLNSLHDYKKIASKRKLLDNINYLEENNNHYNRNLLEGAYYLTTWNRVAPSSNGGNSFTPRVGHASVTIGNNIFIIGGNGGGYLNDIYKSTSGGSTWSFVSFASWSPRGYHSATTIGSTIVVIGGLGSIALKNILKSIEFIVFA